jgi:hypothetical protein
MTLSGNEYGGRRRGPPITRRVMVWVIAMAFIFGAAYISFRQAASLATSQVTEMRMDQDLLERKIDDMALKNAGLQTALEDEQGRAVGLRQKYELAIPDAETEGMLDALRERREGGIAVDRLTEVIAGARNEWTCLTEPETKRFVIQTPLNSGANQQAAFANGTVTVTGTGISVLSEGGLPEAWFDAGEPVTLTFTRIGGESTDIKGILPLHHSLLFGAEIHRFTVIKGDTLSFVDVTGQVCAFP